MRLNTLVLESHEVPDVNHIKNRDHSHNYFRAHIEHVITVGEIVGAIFH